jgi:peptidoglycan/xylan/chitin deacetylase (PgdA/CDA1 family)
MIGRLLVAGVAVAAGVAAGAVALDQAAAPTSDLVLLPVTPVGQMASTPRLAAARHHQRRTPRSRAAVPILMYHVIDVPPPSAAYPGLYVPAPEFAAQMRALHAAGYRTVTMDRIRAAWLGKARLPRKPIVLSFDNGYRSQYTQALPIMRRLGFVGVENIQLIGLPPKRGGLTAAQVRAMIRSGWELDTQGESHADLVRQSAAQLTFQVADARKTLRRRFGVPVNWFCYPSGHYDPRVIGAVRRAGFVGSTTVMPGWAAPGADPYRLPRLRVLGGTSPGSLLADIARARFETGIPVAYPYGA